MTIVREPRDNVLSQWRHCSNDLDGWFSPVGMPPTIEAWLEHWASVVAEDGSIKTQPSSPRTFHCYLPFNLQTRILSCASTDPCLPYSTPALDTTVVADAAAGQAIFAPSLERALRRVEAAERDGGIGFVAVLEHYQQSMCTLHAFERRELPQWCNCSRPRAWSTFPRSHVMHTTLQQQDNASHADRPPAQRLSARAVGLIDALTRMDRRLYEVSLARLRRDSARVEALYGTKLWCDVGSAAVAPAELASSGKSKTHHRRPPWPVGTFNGASNASAFTEGEPTPLISFSPPVGQLVGNVALAVGWGPSQPLWDKYRLSLASLAAAAPTTAAVLFSNVDAPALMRVPRVALPEQLLILNVSLPSLQHAWQFRSLNLTLADSGWWRMPLFASFLVSHCRQADTVFWFDLKDVVFQLSPFELVPKAHDGSRLPTIVSALEPPGSFRYRQWNYKAAAWHLGKLPMDDPACSLSASALRRQLMKKASPAVNLGLVLAPPVLLARQAHRIARMVLKVLLSGRVRPDANGFGGFGIDQGAHLLLAYGALECHTGRNDMSTTPPHWLLTQTANGAGKVLTFGGHAFLVDAAVYKLDAAGIMRSSETGARYAVIHQYDRHPASLQRALWCCRFPSFDMECAGRCPFKGGAAQSEDTKHV